MQFPDAPKNGLAYVFSHFTGIFLTATVILILYVAYSQNDPQVNPKLVGPAILSGSVWALAMAST